MISSEALNRPIYNFFLTLCFILCMNCGGGDDGGYVPQMPPPDGSGPSVSDKDIKAFSILGIAGFVADNTIYQSVPFGTDASSLVASFTSTGVLVTANGITQISGSTANNFTNPVMYTVTARDGSTKSYRVTVAVGPGRPAGAVSADHESAGAFAAVPSAYVTAAKKTLHIAYGHTSHGSQLITGMDAMASADSLYQWNNGGAGGALDLHDNAMDGDVGYYPDWVENTRAYLGPPDPATGRGSANPDVNVVMWSWCAQASEQTRQSMIDRYLAPMTQLEKDYPGVIFVYMTGHVGGTGPTGNLHLRNEQIREYCRINEKILFDFADIESFDPDGVGYMAKNVDDSCLYDGGNWALEWVRENPESDLAKLAAGICDACCTHSQPLNCVLKGHAAWWLWARLAGWNP